MTDFWKVLSSDNDAGNRVLVQLQLMDGFFSKIKQRGVAIVQVVCDQSVGNVAQMEET